MSHTTQRRGLSPERPGEDLVFLAMAPSKYKDASGVIEAMGELAVKMLEHEPVNWMSRNFGDLKIDSVGMAGKMLGVMKPSKLQAVAKLVLQRVASQSSVLTAVYADRDKVEALIRDLKGGWLARNREKGYPISVCLSGLFDDIHECCRANELTEHSYLHSLGYFGKVDWLPSADEMELVTMCGHGLIAVNRIRDRVAKLKQGEMTLREAVEDLVKPCVCGIVNFDRAEEVLKRLAGA